MPPSIWYGQWMLNLQFYRLEQHIPLTTTGCGLMVGVLVLLHLVSSLSDSSIRTSVVHVVLSIAIMWRGVNESTSETPLFFKPKKKKRAAYPSSGLLFSPFYVSVLIETLFIIRYKCQLLWCCSVLLRKKSNIDLMVSDFQSLVSTFCWFSFIRLYFVVIVNLEEGYQSKWLSVVSS